MRRRLENRTTTCECGKTKKEQSHTCERCKFLDGDGDAMTFAIENLRMVGAMTLAQFASQPCAPCQRSMYRALRKLEERGRVRAFDEEDERTTFHKLYALIDAGRVAA